MNLEIILYHHHRWNTAVTRSVSSRLQHSLILHPAPQRLGTNPYCHFERSAVINFASAVYVTSGTVSLPLLDTLGVLKSHQESCIQQMPRSARSSTSDTLPDKLAALISRLHQNVTLFRRMTIFNPAFKSFLLSFPHLKCQCRSHHQELQGDTFSS